MSLITWISIVVFLLITSIGAFITASKKSEGVTLACWAWLICNVIICCFPIIAASYKLVRHGIEVGPMVLGNGDLLIVACAVAADATGRAVICAQKKLKASILALVCLALAGLCGILYSIVLKEGKVEDSVMSADGMCSLFAFMATFIVSGACIIYVESSKEETR